MKAIFLGTGSAQGVPTVFSRNNFFEKIRASKSKDIRSRAALRLDSNFQIDCGPDSNWQNTRYGLDMYDVTNIFITHTHSDHLSCFDLFDVYKMSYEKVENCNPEPINLYLSRAACNWVYNDYLPTVKIKPLEDRIIPHCLEYYHSYDCMNMKFDTIRGSHTGYGRNEYSINYLFTDKKTEKSLLYAVDTGFYEDEAFEYLQNRKSDCIIMECTFGLDYSRGNIGDKHLNLKTFNLQIEKLANSGFLTEKTPVYLTHISPNTELFYRDYQDILSKFDFNYILAYDGLCLNIN